MEHYIELNNRNTWKDFGLRMLERSTDPPEVKRLTTDLPQVQGVLDFSRGNQDELFFNERPLSYKFGRVIPNQAKREILRYEIMRWIYTDSQRTIHDSLYPTLYYSKCTCINLYFSPIKDKYFTVQMDFMSYPLRKSSELEGNKYYDTFNFDTDVWQETTYRTPSILEQLPFKLLNIGDQIHLGGWSQFRPGGKGRLANYETERSYEIIDVRDAGDTDYERLIYSGMQYQLEDNSWVRAQDIVEARTTHTPATLWNVGMVPIIPDIKQRSYMATIAGITIEINGQFYNFHWISANTYAFNDKLSLPIGKSDLKIYGQGMQVDFEFRKEVL